MESIETIPVVAHRLFLFSEHPRICSGTARAEKILLGMESPTRSDDTKLVVKTEAENFSTAPALFGFRRRSSSSLGGKRKSQIKVELPETLEADLCAPLLSEHPSLNVAREFINRAQKTLSSIVLLDKVDQWLEDPIVVNSGAQHDDLIVKAIRNFEKRLGAAWSCLGAAVLLDATCSAARNKLSGSVQALDDISTLQHYSQATLQMMPSFIRLSNRISGVRVILARLVVTEVRCYLCNFNIGIDLYLNLHFRVLIH